MEIAKKEKMSEEIGVIEESAGVSEQTMFETDSIEELSKELNTDLDDHSTRESKINKIQGKFESTTLADVEDAGKTTTSSSEYGSTDTLEQTGTTQEIAETTDYLHDKEWLNKPEHIFVLSSAGKPIYSLHGTEDKLASLFGVMQALVSVVIANQDSIVSIHAENVKFVFLVKGPLILVAISRRPVSDQQIQLQLT